MPEFKKKTALGLRDLPENGQECTHVLLTHSEYDGLLAKVACAERDARSVYTAASQKIAQAERNSAQAKDIIKTACQKTLTLLYRECRGDHWSPASLAQQRAFRDGFLTRHTGRGEQCSPLQEFFGSL